MAVIAFPNKKEETFYDHKITAFKEWALGDIDEKIEPNARSFFKDWIECFFNPSSDIPKDQLSRLAFDTFFTPVSPNRINLKIRVLVTISIATVTLAEECPQIVGFSDKELVNQIFYEDKILPPTVPFSGLITLVLKLSKEGYRIVDQLQKKTDSSVFYTLAKPGSRMVVLELHTGAIKTALEKIKRIFDVDLFATDEDGHKS